MGSPQWSKADLISKPQAGDTCLALSLTEERDAITPPVQCMDTRWYGQFPPGTATYNNCGW
jgi:hypothetical protein